MTELEPLSNRRMRDLEVQRDAARDIALVLEETNEKALRLHSRLPVALGDLPRCKECSRVWPCNTRRALTGCDDEAGAA